MASDQTSANLGELVSSHRNTRRSRVLILVMGLICVLMGAFLGIAPWAFPDPRFDTPSRIITGVVAAGIVYLGFRLLRSLIASRRRVVELYEQGLVDRLVSRTTVAPFAEVATIRSQRLQLVGAYGAVRTKSESHLLKLESGATVSLDHFLEGMNKLGSHLEGEVARHLLPRLRRQLGEGGTVSFGPVSLTPDRISLGGKATATYVELANVVVRDGWIWLYKPGQPGAWRKVSYGNVLNAQAFLTLLRERLPKT